MPRIHPLWIFFQHFVRPWERRAPASTDGMCASPGSALGSASGALTGRRPGRPQPRAAKRVTAAWLPTSRAAARSMSIGGSSPAAPARSPFNNRQSLAIKRSDGGRCTAGRAAPARAPARGRGACAAQGLTSQSPVATRGCIHACRHPAVQACLSSCASIALAPHRRHVIKRTGRVRLRLRGARQRRQRQVPRAAVSTVNSGRHVLCLRDGHAACARAPPAFRQACKPPVIRSGMHTHHLSGTLSRQRSAAS